MDHSPYWIRPDLKPRLRRSTLAAGVLALGAGAMALWMSREHTTFVPVIAPVTVQVPAAAPQITVPTPEVKITLPAPPEPKPAPPPTWHVLAPKLAAACIGPALPMDAPQPADTVVNEACGWDDGFPAIAEDGSLIAMKSSPDAGGRGGSSLYVQFVDPKTSRVVRTDEIMSLDEYWADDKTRSKVVTKISRRIDAVQRMLDVGHYRTLKPLGQSHEGQEPTIDATKLHAEFAGSAVRIVDPATSSVIWQDTFIAGPSHARTGDELCGGWGLRGMSVWWDPATKYVLADMRYRTGGCMCTDDDVVQIKQIP